MHLQRESDLEQRGDYEREQRSQNSDEPDLVCFDESSFLGCAERRVRSGEWKLKTRDTLGEKVCYEGIWVNYKLTEGVMRKEGTTYNGHFDENLLFSGQGTLIIEGVGRYTG